MDKTIILTFTAIAILNFAGSGNIAMAAEPEAEAQSTETECTRKRDPARKQWRNVCRTKTVETSQNDSDQAEHQAEG